MDLAGYVIIVLKNPGGQTGSRDELPIFPGLGYNWEK
jgi:hypothetical protein